MEGSFQPSLRVLSSCLARVVTTVVLMNPTPEDAPFPPSSRDMRSVGIPTVPA